MKIYTADFYAKKTTEAKQQLGEKNHQQRESVDVGFLRREIGPLKGNSFVC